MNELITNYEFQITIGRKGEGVKERTRQFCQIENLRIYQFAYQFINGKIIF